MKQLTSDKDFDSYPLLNRLFYALWLQKKGYVVKKEISFSQWKEIADDLGLIRKSTSIERMRSDDQGLFFDYVLDLGEFVLAWDGEDPIDILSYRVNERLKRRINQFLVVHSG